jgi:Rrf2 family protein
LAYRNAQGPVKIHDIAKAQNVPPRFLEGILNELRHAGLVESRRGSEGGYFLADPMQHIRVVDVIDVVEGGLSVAPQHKPGHGYGVGDHAFHGLWQRVDSEISKVLECTTIADLVEAERDHLQAMTPDYSI